MVSLVSVVLTSAWHMVGIQYSNEEPIVRGISMVLEWPLTLIFPSNFSDPSIQHLLRDH